MEQVDIFPDVAQAPESVGEPTYHHDQDHNPGDPEIKQSAVLLALAQARGGYLRRAEDWQLGEFEGTFAQGIQRSILIAIKRHP